VSKVSKLTEAARAGLRVLFAEADAGRMELTASVAPTAASIEAAMLCGDIARAAAYVLWEQVPCPATER